MSHVCVNCGAVDSLEALQITLTRQPFKGNGGNFEFEVSRADWQRSAAYAVDCSECGHVLSNAQAKELLGSWFDAATSAFMASDYAPF